MGRAESKRLLPQRHHQSCCCLPPHQAAGRAERQVRQIQAASDTHTHSHAHSSVVFVSSRWTAVSRALNEQLQRSRQVLQVWEIYARLASSFSERLQKLQSDVEAELSRASTDDNTVEQIAVKIHNVQVRKKNTGSDFFLQYLSNFSSNVDYFLSYVPSFAE